MKMEQTECSETSAHKIQTPGNYPEESISHSEYGERFKSRTRNKLIYPSVFIEFSHFSWFKNALGTTASFLINIFFSCNVQKEPAFGFSTLTGLYQKT
jgi:hypothetical protein